MRFAYAFIALAAVLLLSVVAFAVDAAPTTGSISGTVVNKEGKAISGATVSILAAAAGRTADPTEVKSVTTDDKGAFSADGLAPGGYLVKFTSGKLAANKSTSVKAGKDTPLGKVTLSTSPTDTGKKVEPKDSSPSK